MAFLGLWQRKSANHSDDNVPQSFNKIWRGFMLYIYLPLSIAYMEILLRLLCGYQFLPGLAYALFLSFGLGLLISALSLLFPAAKVSRAVAGVLTGILCAVFALEYFMFEAYKVFMSFETIFLEAGNVFSEFSGVVISAIIKGVPIIIVFFLPLIIFILLTRKFIPFTADEKKARIRCVLTLVVMLVFAILGQIITLNSNDENKAAYYAEYNFDISSRRLGILTGLGLDIRYAIFGSPYTGAAYFLAEPSEEPSEESLEEPLTYAAAEQLPVTQPSATQSPVTPSAVTQSPVTQPGEEALPDTASVSEPSEPSEPSEASEPSNNPESPEPTDAPKPAGYAYNMMDIDFDKLIAEEKDENIKAISEYVAGLTASRKNEYTGIFKGKNLILLTAEAFTKEVVDAEMTPTLYRLVHEGFYFSDYYQPAWGGSTSSGEFSVLSGLVPTSGAKSILNTIGHNLCFTIGNKLMNLGYSSASYHNGSYTYYSRDKTHTNFGYSTFKAFGNGMEGFVGSMASDHDMMRFTLPQYIDERPFSVYYMTVSGHSTYSQSKNNLAKKNWNAFPQYEELSDTIRAYMAVNLELEYALQYIVSSLESAGIADDTVIALSTDHFPYGLSKSETWGNDKNYLNELYGFDVVTSADRDHNALIIWSGCLENEYKDLAVEVSSPTYSLDILPTLCNLFGVEYDSRLLVGRDVFSDAEPLVLWLDRSWKTDLGYYNASNKTFTPATPDLTIPDDYVKRIRNIVNNKITYSDAAVNHDYFNILFNPDGTVRGSGAG